MTGLIIRRLGLAVPLLLIVSSLTFILVSLIPGSVAASLLGVSATPAEYAAIEQRLGLNQPVYVQYWHWLSHAFLGNLGVSLQNSEPVASMIDQRIAVTLSLVVLTMLVVTVFGVAAGLTGALNRGGRIGRAIDGLSWLGLAIPNFWLGLLLVALFSVTLNLLPAGGYVPFTTSPVGWLKSLVLPVIALSAGPFAVVAKQTRDAMIEELGRPYVRTLRAAGLSERSVVHRHALKNAAIPVVTVLGVLSAQMLGGTVIVETVFVLPGLGSLALAAVSAHDLPVVEGVAVCFTLIVIAMNLLVDIAYGWLNPKVRVR